MDCERVRDELLDDPGGHPAHLAECPACAAFAAQQRALDAQLARAFPPPSLSASFRPALRARMRRERSRAWIDALPDIVHFASCGVATLACAALAPLAATTVLTSGIAIALGSYVVTSALRQSINELEQPDR
jgi:anti-sigma factor RsiW